ncbi:MAG: HAD family hydrolase [Desulfuromonadales bacterium]|nr:HAD family hydrolase [Desulfuromonadales bacterium]
MLNPKGIVFDCDGVLFESKSANLAYYNEVLSAFDVEPVTIEQQERAHICHTAATPQVFVALLGPEQAPLAIEMVKKLDYKKFIPFMTPEPHLHEVIAALATHYPLAVATNRGTSMVEILTHFSLAAYFKAVITSRDVLRPKPFPDMLHLAAQRLGFAAEELLFVGDSELDAAAAIAAGMPFIAYKSIQGEAPVIASHREIFSLLGREEF